MLDLDITVWGGVVGDVGMENIAIAEGDAVGEAFRSVQRFALELRERGVVLAVSSKNDDAVARRVFREHPDMLLRENHIAVFQANWKDKASNIKAISEELSLGLDAFVFLDDNPAERGIVRQMLPDVTVPELPADPAYYARTLAAAGYFESTVFSPEDRQRADYYERNAKRVALQKELGGLDEYLASLDMEITFSPFDAYGRDRIAQLINKSNQFNLTTKRYTPAEIAQLERDSDVLALQIRLSDVFGDNGMISVVICRRADRAVWTIDTWLMSCRVLGRGVERMVLRELIARARVRHRASDRLLHPHRPQRTRAGSLRVPRLQTRRRGVVLRCDRVGAGTDDESSIRLSRPRERSRAILAVGAGCRRDVSARCSARTAIAQGGVCEGREGRARLGTCGRLASARLSRAAATDPSRGMRKRAGLR